MNNTMKLEQQVTSLELSKKLKKLGVKQDSLFYWLKPLGDNGKPNGKYFLNWIGSYDFCDDDSHDHKLISAFTVAELGEILPSWVYTTKDDGTNKSFTSWYGDENTPNEIDVDGDNNIQHAETEADARAKMLIWLIEEGYITQ